MPPYLFAKVFLALTCLLGVASAAWADTSTASISGNVAAAASSAPISGAKITVFRYGIFSFVPVATTTTDASGHYQVDDVELQSGSTLYVQADAGDYWIVQSWPGADCPPVPQFCGPIGSSVSVTAGETSMGVNFALNVGGVIQGHITRTDNGLPVANADIAPFYVGNDSDGLFRLRSARPGQYTIWVEADGFITTFHDGQQCDDFIDCTGIVAQPFDVSANATTTVDIALEPGVTISGQVVVDGDPSAPRPQVLLYNESDPQRPSINGYSVGFPALPHDYVFRNLIARTYSVRFGDPADSRYVSEFYNNVICEQDPCDMTAVAKFFTVSGQQIPDIDATVTPRQKVIGRVIDAVSQAPLAAADVQAVVPENIIFLGWNWKSIAETSTDASGNFTLVGIPENTAFALRFNAADHLGVQTPDVVCDDINSFCASSNTGVYPPPASVAADTTLNAGDIALSQGATISGHVTNLRNGQGLPNSQVVLYLNDEIAKLYDTDINGNYSTSMLRTAEFKAVASSLYESQMYDHVNCPAVYTCDLALATPIPVSGTGTFSAIDFSLHDPDVVFSSGFDN